MPIKEEMQTLVEEIIRSYEDRTAGIAQLRDEAKEVQERAKTDLKEFRDTWTAMGWELRADLARSVADHKRDVGAMLKGFEAELKELNRTRDAMSTELRADLSRSAAGLKRDVTSVLEGFDETHAAMSRQMKAGLSEGVAGRKHDVGAELKGFDVKLKEVRTALAGARAEWQKMTATMQAKRGMLAVEVKLPETVAPAPVGKATEEDAVARAEAGEAIPEIAALQDRAFEYLANHPDGRRLVELEKEFGLPRVQMARVLRTLMDKNKVEKQGPFYFAV